MYHSVSFWGASSDTATENTGRNTWASWRLIPTSRPYFPPPTPKTNYVDVPYMDGSIDISILSGMSNIAFEDREGSFEFLVINPMIDGYDVGKKRHNDGNKFNRESMEDGSISVWPWDIAYSKVMNYLHGTNRKIVLEDDPSFYYLGRCSVSGWSSEEHYSKITIDAKVEPYKKLRFSTAEDWLWDAIDFDINPDIVGFKHIPKIGSNSLNRIVLSPNDDDPLLPNEIESGTFKTFRKKIVPSVKIKFVSGERETHAPFIYAHFIIKDSDGERTIEMGLGTNKVVNSVVEEYGTIDDLYFAKNSDVEFRLVNMSEKAFIKVEVDYRLEGL